VRLEQVYAELGYEVVTLPRIGVAERADFMLFTLAKQFGP
jgi:predicted ATPase